MDLARISHYGYPASYPLANRSRERVLELVAEVEPTPSPRPDRERVVQGEVLQRQQTAYSATRDYLNSRVYDGSYANDDSGASRRPAGNTSAQAVGAYLSHTRELIQPDSGRGKQVDYFI